MKKIVRYLFTSFLVVLLFVGNNTTALGDPGGNVGIEPQSIGNPKVYWSHTQTGQLQEK